MPHEKGLCALCLLPSDTELTSQHVPCPRGDALQAEPSPAAPGRTIHPDSGKAGAAAVWNASPSQATLSWMMTSALFCFAATATQERDLSHETAALLRSLSAGQASLLHQRGITDCLAQLAAAMPLPPLDHRDAGTAAGQGAGHDPGGGAAGGAQDDHPPLNASVVLGEALVAALGAQPPGRLAECGSRALAALPHSVIQTAGIFLNTFGCVRAAAPLRPPAQPPSPVRFSTCCTYPVAAASLSSPH